MHRVEHRFVAGRRMPRDDGERRRDAAMGHRDARERRGGDRRADAGDHLERDPRRAQREPFLAAAAEDERVAALETDDALSAPRGADHQRMDGLLAHARPSGALADGKAPGAARQRHRLRADEGVEQHQIRAAEARERGAGQQARIAGPGARRVRRIRARGLAVMDTASSALRRAAAGGPPSARRPPSTRARSSRAHSVQRSRSGGSSASIPSRRMPASAGASPLGGDGDRHARPPDRRRRDRRTRWAGSSTALTKMRRASAAASATRAIDLGGRRRHHVPRIVEVGGRRMPRDRRRGCPPRRARARPSCSRRPSRCRPPRRGVHRASRKGVAVHKNRKGPETTGASGPLKRCVY